MFIDLYLIICIRLVLNGIVTQCCPIYKLDPDPMPAEVHLLKQSNSSYIYIFQKKKKNQPPRVKTKDDRTFYWAFQVAVIRIGLKIVRV